MSDGIAMGSHNGTSYRVLPSFWSRLFFCNFNLTEFELA